MNISDLISVYNSLLGKYPLPTKAVTSAGFAIVGDLVGSALQAQGGKQKSNVNLRRAAVFGAYGMLIVGPTLHYWYGYLEKLTASVSKDYKTVIKIILDRLVFTPPFLALTLFFLKYFSEKNTTAAQVVSDVRSVFSKAFFASVKVWTLFQLINFSYVPLELRPLAGNVMGFWWNVYLSWSAV